MSTGTASAAQAASHGQHAFKAEIRQLLDILIHSVYTSKDVFLRELISNATDALEKVRFSQAGGQALQSPDLPLEIRIDTQEVDGDKILTIADTGIGMTEAEVHENIGTIAHSGATAFLEQLKQQNAGGAEQLSLIGRFGVGFYSVFMVAKKVVLTTRSGQADAKPVVWTSDGLGSYAIETLDSDLPRGTKIEIHLRGDDAKFADEHEIRSAIERYSNFVSFPVLVNGERVNQATALWREPASQITSEQYNEFYKLISHDFADPLIKLHYSVDAPLQFSSLLFVPSNNPESLGFGRGEVSLQLYVKRVLIDRENNDLLPPYLRFVKGVVESDDVPLNVSRETLQENRLVAKIRDSLTRRLLDELLTLAKTTPKEYDQFWRAFGRIVKEGYNDYRNREKFQDLLRFDSSRFSDAQSLVSLAEYADKMPEGQTAIYYLSGPSRESLERDARLELFRKRGIEVLYLDELADEFVLSSLEKYRDKPLVSADQVKPEDLKNVGGDGSDAESAASDQAAADIEPLIARFKEILASRVTQVRASQRLVDSPACLVSDEQQLSGHMDKVIRMMNKSSDLPQRVLELNPQHPLVKNLGRLVAADRHDPLVELACEQIFEGAMLVDGYLTDPHKLVERMNRVLLQATDLKTAK